MFTTVTAQIPLRARRSSSRWRAWSVAIASLTLLAALVLGWTPASAFGSSPPSSTSPPTISGLGRVGEMLTADDGTFAGNPDPTIERQWQRCDADGWSCTPIEGETASTYVIVDDDLGGTLRVAVTATNTDDPDIWISALPSHGERDRVAQLAGDTTNNTFSVTVLSDPIAVLAPPEDVVPAPAPAPVVLARTVLSVGQPHVQCTTLARRVEPGTPGPLVASGDLDGTVTIRAARRPVLRIASSAGTVQLQAGRMLAHADGVGALSWTQRSTRRVALESSDGRLLIAVGRNAHHPTRTVIKSRLCSAPSTVRERVDGRADQAVHAAVYATAADGTPIAHLPLAATAAGTSLRVLTDANGRAQVWLPAGGRRDLHVEFAGDATHAPAAVTVPITSAATSTLTLVSGVLPAHAPAEFAGRLAGRDGTPTGSRITLSYRTPDGSWRTVGRGLVDARGNWTITTAPPRATPGRPVAAYRVLVEPGPAFPYGAALGSPTTFHVTRGATR